MNTRTRLIASAAIAAAAVTAGCATHTAQTAPTAEKMGQDGQIAVLDDPRHLDDAHASLIGGVIPTKLMLSEATVRAIPRGAEVWVAGGQDGLRRGSWLGVDGNVVLAEFPQPLRENTAGATIFRLDERGNGEVIGIVEWVTRGGYRIEGHIMARALPTGSHVLLTPQELWK